LDYIVRKRKSRWKIYKWATRGKIIEKYQESKKFENAKNRAKHARKIRLQLDAGQFCDNSRSADTHETNVMDTTESEG